MSTGFECEFIETQPANWYYVLQDWDCPVGASDWHEYATAYGPFPTLKDAEQHLTIHQANPGGWGVRSFDPTFRVGGVLAKVIAKART